MQRQVGQNGEVLAIRPRFLVVPLELELTALQVTAEITPNTTGEVNPFAGRLEVLVEPGLTDPAAWYVSADPARADALAHAYLNDMTGPQVEVREGWEVEGTEFKCRMDFGDTVLDWRGLYCNPGA